MLIIYMLIFWVLFPWIYNIDWVINIYCINYSILIIFLLMRLNGFIVIISLVDGKTIDDCQYMEYCNFNTYVYLFF